MSEKVKAKEVTIVILNIGPKEIFDEKLLVQI